MEVPGTMQAVRLRDLTGIDGVTVEEIATPRPQAGDALVRVHAASITRDELEWPTDRLPAIPSYELSGTLVSEAPEAEGLAAGDAVYALTAFDRDGVAAAYAAVPVALLAPKPRTLSHTAAATVPMPALTAWQGLFEHGGLEHGQKVVVHGAGGGVGSYAVQLARWRGAYVVGTASPATLEAARDVGADEVLERESALADVTGADLVFDTVGGDALARSAGLVRKGGRIVSVAEEPPKELHGLDALYFVVRPDGRQLREITPLVESGTLRPAIDSVFPLADARAAFERSLVRGKSGKVVLEVVAE